MKESTDKLYFESIDATICYPIEYHFLTAKRDGLKEIELVEAIPDTDTKDFIWCSYHGEVTERQDCRKINCEQYYSSSCRGVCRHRGQLFLHGDTVKFKVK